MGDPRMHPPMPIGVMPPLSNEFTENPDAGLSGQEYAEKYNIPYAKGGIAGQLNRPGYFAGDVVDPEGYNISRRELGILANADPSKEEMIRKFLNRIKHHKPIYPDRILEINRGRRAGAKGGLAKVLGV